MESLFKNPIIRNLLAIALGVVIIINPQLGPNIVIMLIGAALAIPALLAIIGYFSYKNKETPMPGYVLVESIGALVIGAWMLLQPTFFNAVILIALGIILLLAGISQIISLIRSGQIMPIPIGMYVYCTGTDHDSGIPHDFQAFRNGKSHHDDIRYIDGDLRYIGYDTVLQIPTIIYKRMGRELKFPPHAFYNVLSDITLFYLLSVPPLFLLPKNRLFQIAPRYCTTKSIC